MSYCNSVWPTIALIIASFLPSAENVRLFLQAVGGLALISGVILFIVGILLVGMIGGRIARAQKRAQLKRSSTITNEPQERSEQPQRTSDTQQPAPAAPLDSPAEFTPVQSPVPDEQTTLQPQSISQQEQTIPEKTVRLGVVFGTDRESGRKIVLSQNARRQGLSMIGVNGTGKSTLMANLIAQDMEQGLGLCLLDPQGDLTNDVLAHVPEYRVQDVILLDLKDTEYPFGLNIFSCPAPDDVEQVALTASCVMHVFEKVWHVDTHTPLLAQVLQNVAFTLIENPGTTFNEIPLMLQDQTTREKFVGNVTNSQVRQFWQSYNERTAHDQMTHISSTLRKVDTLLNQSCIANIVGQSITTLDFRTIMDERKILLVQLDPSSEDVSSLVGAVILGQLLNTALSRKDLSEFQRKQFNVYTDEYEKFATEHLVPLLSEARHFGIATTVAYQCLEQLDEKNRRASVNAANVVVFRVIEQDAEELVKVFDATPSRVVLREMTRRVPTSNAVKYLLKYGHPDASVAEFTTRYLVPAKRLEQRVFTGNKEARASKNMRTVGVPQLNRFLYQVMDEKNASLPIPEEIMRAFQNMPPWYYSQGSRGDFPCSLLNVMQVLAKEPIMVDSKHYEPVYDQPRMSAGGQNQIATELTTLPNYQAKIKMVNGERWIETSLPMLGLSENLLEARRTRVRERTRTRYCRKRTDVENDIKLRQEQLSQEHPAQHSRREEGLSQE
jgi:hypothetical protein